MNFILSMNIRGLGAGQNFLALKNPFFANQPKIILIQETMHNTLVSISYFRKMLPTWHMVAVEANGQFGGLTVLWEPKWIKAKAYKCFVGILISASIRGKEWPINILNMYAPYKNRINF